MLRICAILYKSMNGLSLVPEFLQPVMVQATKSDWKMTLSGTRVCEYTGVCGVHDTAIGPCSGFCPHSEKWGAGRAVCCD